MLGQEIDQIAGRDVYGADGEKIGTARQVYTDDQTGEPAWATVRTGLLGLKESFVPLTDAEMSGDRFTVPYTKGFVKDAPNIDEDGHITPDQEQELYAYYGRTSTTHARGDYGAGRTGGTAGRLARVTRDADTEGYASGPTDDAMTVSEERVNVGKQRRESGRARLRKYVVTEQVTHTVPVQHEEVRVEREPITESNRGRWLRRPGHLRRRARGRAARRAAGRREGDCSTGAGPARHRDGHRPADRVRGGPQGTGRRRTRYHPRLQLRPPATC